MNSINFEKRKSIEQVEESSELAPKFDESGLIPVVTTSSISSSTASCAYIDVVNGKSTISDNKYLFTVFPFLMYIKVYVCI